MAEATGELRHKAVAGGEEAHAHAVLGHQRVLPPGRRSGFQLCMGVGVDSM